MEASPPGSVSDIDLCVASCSWSTQGQGVHLGHPSLLSALILSSRANQCCPILLIRWQKTWPVALEQGTCTYSLCNWDPTLHAELRRKCLEMAYFPLLGGAGGELLWSCSLEVTEINFPHWCELRVWATLIPEILFFSGLIFNVVSFCRYKPWSADRRSEQRGFFFGGGGLNGSLLLFLKLWR